MIKVLFHSILAQALGFSLGVTIGYLFGASEWFALVVLLSHLFGALFVSIFLKLRRTWIYFNALVPLGILLITVVELPVSSTLLCLVTLFGAETALNCTELN